jgi:hypothetical protein
MIWDIVLAYIGLTFAAEGWNAGLLNSWRSPIAVVLATLAQVTR